MLGNGNEALQLRSRNPVDRGVFTLPPGGRIATRLCQCRTQVFQKAPYPRQQDRTELGDVTARAPALEQLRVQPVFEGVDRLAHSGLRKMDVSCRRADALQARDGFEGAQLPQ